MRAILRHRRNSMSEVRTRLLYSSRTVEDIIYRADLDEEDVVHTLTRARPPGWTGYARRVDADLLRDVAWPAEDGPLAFVCGPTSFVESVAAGLVKLGYAPGRIRTERFGATGGR
jgi:ferredoxin-NADP reductase